MTQFNDSKIVSLISEQEDDKAVAVNNHIHSPYSFSSFSSIEQAVDLAVKEGINVLGINDFFVTHGYALFNETCLKKGVYPMFNIEFIGLHKQFQSDGLRINDPNNPGRIYLSGKGLKKSYTLSKENQEKFDVLIESSQLQIREMIVKLNEWLSAISAPFKLSYEEVQSKFAKQLVRERHIATAIRNAVNELFKSTDAKLNFYAQLFGEPAKSDIDKPAAIEEELRGKLLKAGGKAFVAEDEKAFLSPEEIASIISDAGGIITYPLLLDDAKGNYTDFEKDKELLAKRLKELNIFSIEFIPSRNSFEALKDYSEWFYKQGFLVSYGTEHNTPALTPLEVSCRNGVKLNNSLLEINYKCTCMIAAHQYLVENGLEGYLDAEGKPDLKNADKFVQLGNALIKKHIR